MPASVGHGQIEIDPEQGVLRYEGDIYIRPVARGIVLEPTGHYLNDVIEGLYEAVTGENAWGNDARIRLVVELLDPKRTG